MVNYHFIITLQHRISDGQIYTSRGIFIDKKSRNEQKIFNKIIEDVCSEKCFDKTSVAVLFYRLSKNKMGCKKNGKN